MSEFFDKSIDDLMGEGASKKVEVPVESKEEAIRQIILEDFKSMLSFQKERVDLVYPTPVEPRWKS